MKAQTQIERAVKACYDAYAEYARKVDNIPVIPQFPKVTWVRGSLKNEASGWLIDGKLYNGTAQEVVSHWNKQTERWTAKLRKKLETPLEQLELSQGEGGGEGYQYQE
jgi:hypothetical protein